MPSAIAAHFENLRHRFPDESGNLITKAQYSFESMDALAKVQRPAQCRSAYFELGGTDFLVWEMAGDSDHYKVFATSYNIPLGTLRPSTKPSGIIIVDGFYIDLAQLSERITKSFEDAKSTAVSVGAKKNNILLFGFHKSLGHHFWNEVSGLASTLATGQFDSFDGVIVGPFDYFNIGAALQARGKQIWKLNANGLLVSPDRLLVYHNNVVTNETRNLVLNITSASPTPIAHVKSNRAICFQIRRKWRPWVNEENGLVEIIKTLASEWPNTVFYIDGHSTSKGLINLWQHDIDEEQAFFERIKNKTTNISLHSTIGMDLSEKINVFKNIDLFVGPIGSGGVISSWLLRKPTITYGPTSTYSMMWEQEQRVPEGGSRVAAVSPDLIKDQEGDKNLFDVPVEAILRLAREEIHKTP